MKGRAIVGSLLASLALSSCVSIAPAQPTTKTPAPGKVSPAAAIVNALPVKGRAPKTGYDRDLFPHWSGTWPCDTRQRVLRRDLHNLRFDGCRVVFGKLTDPYTGRQVTYTSRNRAIQIDHVVSLSDAWQKGAQQWAPSKREAFANDALNLLATSSRTNQAKSDADAASWLPPRKAYRCQFVARQAAVKHRYGVWVTKAEKATMQAVLRACPNQRTPA